MNRISYRFGLACFAFLSAAMMTGCAHSSGQAADSSAAGPSTAAASAAAPQVPPAEQAYLKHMKQTQGGAPSSSAH